MNALENAIYQKLISDSGLMSMLANGNSVYAYSVPENAPLPAIVFFEQTGSPQYTFEKRASTEWLYGIKAITQDKTTLSVEAIDEAIDTLINDATLSVNGSSTSMCRRETSISPYVEWSNGVRYNHAGGSYRIWMGE